MESKKFGPIGVVVISGLLISLSAIAIICTAWVTVTIYAMMAFGYYWPITSFFWIIAIGCVSLIAISAYYIIKWVKETYMR